LNLVAYLRVSTQMQADERRLGLPVQERAIRRWAREAGHRIVSVKADKGISGGNGLDTRLALAEALELVRSRRAGGVVVYRLDRLARDLVLQEQLLAEIWRMGAQVFTTSAGEAGYLSDDPEDPSRKLIRQVLGAVSEYERDMIVLRLRAGRRLKAERGGYACGAPPFGSRAENRELVTDAAEAATVALIVRLRKRGLSLRQIGAELEAGGHAPKYGTRWHPATVARAIARAA
jgi:DNA invertase Pin-like site-specific DNA recombinase